MRSNKVRGKGERREGGREIIKNEARRGEIHLCERVSARRPIEVERKTHGDSSTAAPASDAGSFVERDGPRVGSRWFSVPPKPNRRLRIQRRRIEDLRTSLATPFRPELRATHLVDHLPEQPLLPNHLETSLLCAALHKHPRRVPRRCERRAFRRRNRARELLRARKVSCGVERAAEDEPCRPCSPRSSSRPPSLLLPTQRTYRVPRSSLRGSQTYPAR